MAYKLYRLINKALTVNLYIMKTNVDFPKRAKNSFIYFQVGLIATMVVILFVLEFNFENKVKKITHNPTDLIVPEATFVYNPAPATKAQEVSKPIAVKVPVVVHSFKPTKEEPKKEENDFKAATQDAVVDNTPVSTKNLPSDTNVPVKPREVNVFSVEQLPMFQACKGLSREQQKACFDEQLTKAIVKHLIYPEDDLKDGNQGVVQVEFVIDEKGAITNVTALNNKRSTKEMQLAAEKAVKRIPKLIPAMQGDTPVKIKYTIPVGFRLK